MEYHATYNHNKITIIQSQLTGKEVVKINGTIVSTINAALKNNTYHKISIKGPNTIESGFVNIKTYFMDCKCVYRIVINNTLIATKIYDIPVQMNFRELGIWLIFMAICGYFIFGINKALNLIGKPIINIVAAFELVVILLACSYIARRFGNALGEKAKIKMEAEIKNTRWKQ